MSLERVPYAQLEMLDQTGYRQADETVYSKTAWLAATGLFDADYYLAMNKDVAKNGIDPILHYVSQGWKENRNPAPWFDNRLYREENSEVGGCPFLHYIIQGYMEGRRANKDQVRKVGRLVCVISTTTGKAPEKMAAAILSGKPRVDKLIFYTRRELFKPSSGLEALLAQGLEIRFHDYPATYGPLCPALDDFPEDIIAAWRGDDNSDMNWLETLWATFQANRDCVCSCAIAQLDSNSGRFLPGPAVSKGPNFLNIPFVEHGIIFNARGITKKFFYETLLRDLAPDYADAWFWLMFLLSGKKIVSSGNDSGDSWRIARDHIKELKNVIFFFREEASEILGKDVHDLFLRQEIVDFYHKMKKLKLNLESPSTFNEKLNYLKVYADQRQNTILSDKYRARTYAMERIGGNYLPKLYGVWNRVEEINFDRLPDSFVLKTNHACGTNIIVKDKKLLNVQKAAAKMDKWLKMNYDHYFLEMNYCNINPLIMAEEYLGENLMDYKCMCFNGETEFIWVDLDRFTNHTRNVYSRDWKRLDLKFAYDNSPREVPMPARLQEMLECCQSLAYGLPHVRCDFYVLSDGRLKLGELTFYSESGVANFEPPEENHRLGEKIIIDNLPKLAAKNGLNVDR